MFIKTRTIVILAALLVALGLALGSAMTSAKSKLVAFMKEASTIHNYHGICNGGVGEPYSDFIHELRTMAERGDTNRLAIVLRRADERSRDIYEVWLRDGYGNDYYRKSIDEILK